MDAGVNESKGKILHTSHKQQLIICLDTMKAALEAADSESMQAAIHAGLKLLDINPHKIGEIELAINTLEDQEES